jgi:hypothetical protein
MNVIVWYFDLHLLVQPVPVTTGATSGAGTTYPSGTPGFTPGS